MDPRLLVALISNLGLFLVIVQGNELLSGLNVSLFVEALYLLFAGLFLSLGQSLLILVIPALFLDAMGAGPFGWRLVIYTVVLVFIMWTRRRIRRERADHILAVALVGNALLMLLMLPAAPLQIMGYGAFWLRFFTDLLLSEVVVFFVAYRFLEMQRQILFNIGINVALEPSQG